MSVLVEGGALLDAVLEKRRDLMNGARYLLMRSSHLGDEVARAGGTLARIRGIDAELAAAGATVPAAPKSETVGIELLETVWRHLAKPGEEG